MRRGSVLACLLLVSLAARAGSSRADPIPLRKGLPKEAGLDKLVIVTDLPGRDPRVKAIQRLARARQAKLLRWRDGELDSIARPLRREGAEFVAFALAPETVDTNLHYGVIELSRDLDPDPMPDFHFGYLCARTGDDLDRMVERILAREANPPEAPRAETVVLAGEGGRVRELDYVLHFGHGQAWRVEQGMTGREVGALDLPRAPVVWSGACFNGVLSRSFHKCAYQPVFFRPTTIDPEDLMTLNWVHAGATGYFAAMEGDRGEMAMAEWEYFRARACSLGEAIGLEYRLACLHLPPDFERFPRQRHMHKKRMSFCDVMLRGMVSRMLLSDPSYRPAPRPLDAPIHRTRAEYDASSGALSIEIEVLRHSQGLHLNVFPEANNGVFDARVTERLKLPADLPDRFAFGDPRVSVTTGNRPVEPTRIRIRHEVWGAKRYLNVQVELPPGQVQAGTKVSARW